MPRMSPDARIHVVHLLYRLGMGGVERQLVSLACGLPRERFRQSFITAVPEGHRSDELRTAGVELVCMPRRGAFDPGYLSAVRRFLCAEQPDILNTRGIGASIWWQVLGRRAPRPPACVVTRSAFEIRASAFTHWLSVRQLQLSEQVVANSQSLLEQLEQQHAFLRGKVQLIPNGVDIERFGQPIDRTAVLLREGLNPGLPLVLSAGRLHSVKDFPLFIAAAAKLSAAGLSAQYAIAGSGEERDALLKLIERQGLNGRFHLLPAREAIEDLLRASGIFVLSSRSESSNNALMEALAAGRACVSTRVSGSSELLGGGAHGRLVETGHAEQLADDIAQYLRDPELAARDGAAGREYMRQHFNLQDTVNAYARLFERLAADRQAARQQAH